VTSAGELRTARQRKDAGRKAASLRALLEGPDCVYIQPTRSVTGQTVNYFLPFVKVAIFPIRFGHEWALHGCCRLIYRIHDLPDGYAPLDKLHHALHGGIDVMVEVLESLAKVIQSRYSIGRFYKAMFRTSSAAGKKHVATAATSGQGGCFGGAECNLWF
jgi:hypothetical protein